MNDLARARLFQRSVNTVRLLSLPRPKWRGVSHRVAAIVAVPAGIWLTAAAPAGDARLGAFVFAVGVFLMFAFSALFHLRRWGPHTTEVLLRLDHTGIYLMFAGTTTPLALLGLHGTTRAVVLWALAVALGIGIVVEWLPFATPKGVANTIYLTLGWASLVLVPALWRNVGPAAVALLLGGGVLYTVGAIIVGTRRPDPNPHVFGYHEIWHLMVIGAVALHYVMVGTTLLPIAAG